MADEDLRSTVMKGPQAYEYIIALCQESRDDVEKFYDKGVGAAGGRLRKLLKEINEVVKSEKKNILEVKAAKKQ